MSSKQKREEKNLLPLYRSKNGGFLYREVRVGTTTGSDKWGTNCSHRDIDGVLLSNGPEDIPEMERVFKYSASKYVFQEYLTKSRIELLEAKTELNTGVIGQIIAAGHLFNEQIGLKHGVRASRSTIVIPKSSSDPALEEFCRKRHIGVAAVEGIQHAPWPSDSWSGKDDMLSQYHNRSDKGGILYRKAFVGDQKLWAGCGCFVVDGIRLSGVRKGKAILDFNNEHFYERVKDSEAIELIQIPHINYKRKLIRGVIGRLVACQYMFEKQYGVKVNPIVLCLGTDDALAWVCHNEGIKVESPHFNFYD